MQYGYQTEMSRWKWLSTKTAIKHNLRGVHFVIKNIKSIKFIAKNLPLSFKGKIIKLF